MARAANCSFRVLGPLEVAVGGAPINLGGTKPRQLLATLLIKSHTVVSTRLLTETLWPEHPPASAVANIRTYVSALRGKLPAAVDGPRFDVRPTGYRIRVSDDELDLMAYESLVAHAREHREAGREDDALEAYRRSRELWRGEILADLPTSSAWEAEIGQLTGTWFAAEEERLALLSAAGRFDAVVDEARALVAEHPFREPLWWHLIDALDRGGRDAEAIAAYAQVRGRLRDHLGVEPGRSLRRLHERLLAETGSFPIRQLPPASPDFTGRVDELDALVAAISRPGPGAGGSAGGGAGGGGAARESGQPGIAAVVGPPGVGKTALAIQVAHRVGASFPDGQLYVDLGGTDTDGRTVSDLLAELLVGLGVTGSVMPAREAERAALFRSRIAGRSLLLVYDNAADTEQVKPLIPATDRCAVLVTSRHRLSDLAVTHRVDLDVLPPTEAERLLARLVGTSRVRGEPAAAREITAACGRFPLAIRMAGARLADRQRWSLEVFVDRLRDESRRLSELRVGSTGVRASFDLSLARLPESAALLFRRLGSLMPRPQPEWVLVALLADQPDQPGSAGSADDAIESLLEANLLYAVGTDVLGQPRYSMHDLLWAYAKEAAGAEADGPRTDAVRRVLGGWLRLMEEAVVELPVSLTPAVKGTAPRWDPGEKLRARVVDVAGDWFDAERAMLLATIDLAARHRRAEFAWELAVALEPYLDLGSHHDAWIRTFRNALEVVRAAGEARGEAVLLRALGQVLIYEDSCAEALALMRRSFERFRAIGDEAGAGRAYAGVTSAYRVAGRHEQAARAAMRAIPLLRRTGLSQVEAQARANLGMTLVILGRDGEAEEHFIEALRLARELGDRHREANVLRRYSELTLGRGDPRGALAMLIPAVDIFSSIDDQRCGAYALLNCGRAYLDLDDPVRAEVALTKAEVICRTMGDRQARANCARLLGDAAIRLGCPAQAREHLAVAIELGRDLPMDDHLATATRLLAQLPAPTGP